jgi:hypothetical protein
MIPRSIIPLLSPQSQARIFELELQARPIAKEILEIMDAELKTYGAADERVIEARILVNDLTRYFESLTLDAEGIH